MDSLFPLILTSDVGILLVDSFVNVVLGWNDTVIAPVAVSRALSPSVPGYHFGPRYKIAQAPDSHTTYVLLVHSSDDHREAKS